MNKQEQTIHGAVDIFRAVAEAQKLRYLESNSFQAGIERKEHVIQVQETPKYFKLWCTSMGKIRSIHSFVDKTTGNIYYPSGTKAPAKHARGNVLADDCGTSALTGRGDIRTLRQ